MMDTFLNNYIGAGTQALYPVFEDGYPLTKIYTVSGESIIQMPTIQIIKQSIIRYGSNYEGAVKSAIFYLGGSYVHPLQISGQYKIYMFPTKACLHAECVWIALDHYKGCEKVDSQRTRVYLSHDRSIIVDCKTTLLMKRYNKALNLKNKIDNFLINKHS